MPFQQSLINWVVVVVVGCSGYELQRRISQSSTARMSRLRQHNICHQIWHPTCHTARSSCLRLIFFFLSHFVSSFMYTFHPMTLFFVKYVAHFEYFTFHPKMTTTKTQTITKTTGCLSEVEYNNKKKLCHDGMSSTLSDSVIQSFGCVCLLFSVLNLSVIAWYLVFCTRINGLCRFSFEMILAALLLLFFIYIFRHVRIMGIDGLMGHLSHCNRNIVKHKWKYTRICF